MAVSRITRQIGHLCRIYKNSDGKIIAIDDIEVVGNVLKISDTKFHVSVDKISTSRTLLHLGVGGRVVYSINTIGNYSSIAENGGNYLTVGWDAASENENRVEVSIEPYVSVIGDTI